MFPNFQIKSCSITSHRSLMIWVPREACLAFFSHDFIWIMKVIFMSCGFIVLWSQTKNQNNTHSFSLKVLYIGLYIGIKKGRRVVKYGDVSCFVKVKLALLKTRLVVFVLASVFPANKKTPSVRNASLKYHAKCKSMCVTAVVTPVCAMPKGPGFMPRNRTLCPAWQYFST